MAKTTDSYEFEDGTGVVETRDGDNVTTIHYTPKAGYPKASPSKEGPVRLSDIGKNRQTGQDS